MDKNRTKETLIFNSAKDWKDKERLSAGPD